MTAYSFGGRQEDVQALERAFEMMRQGEARHKQAALNRSPSMIVHMTQIDSADLTVLGKKAALIYSGRRARDKIFADSTLFAEPAWDMLLDLFVAAVERRSISVSSATMGAAVPPTTGLRWLQTLENDGLIERRFDPSDGRRSFVHLTDRGFVKVAQAVAVA